MRPGCIVLLLAALAACNSSDLTEEDPACGPGGSCPSGLICNAVTGRCVRGTAHADAGDAAPPRDAPPPPPPDAPPPPPPDAPPPDITPPETTITGKPSAISGRDVTFIFEASEPASFECRLDSASFASCASPLSYTQLDDTPAPHAFEVRAKDLAGNVDPTPARHEWTVDHNALDTRITASPPTVSGPDVIFSFAATRAATFECRLTPRDADFAPCATPLALAGLGEGGNPYALAVRAVDVAGNRDDTPATFSWRVDATPPAVRIDAPAGTTGPRPTMRFSVEAGATLSCIVDRGAPFACGSDQPVPRDLAEGAHELRVRAADAVGNAAEATARWTVDATPPSLTVFGPGGGEITGKVVRYRYESDGSVACRLDGAELACSTAQETRLVFERSGPHTLLVTATDAVGNVTSEMRGFTVDADPPTVSLIGPTDGARTSGKNLLFLSTVSEGIQQCWLGSDVVPCNAPFDRPPGAYRYEVVADDLHDNVVEVTRAWTIVADDDPLPIAIRSPHPGAKRGNPVWVAFEILPFNTFGGDGPETWSFECLLDWASPRPCYPGVAGVSLGDVAAGRHTLSVRATRQGKTIVHSGWFDRSSTAPVFTSSLPRRGTVVAPPLAVAHDGGAITCRVDDGAAQACASGQVIDLPVGANHHLEYLLAGGHSEDLTFREARPCGHGATDAATLAMWAMDGTQRVEDLSGNGRHLTLGTAPAVDSNDPGYFFGKVGPAVRFDDAGDVLTAATDVHAVAGGMTFEAWVMTETETASGTILVATLASGQQRRLDLELLSSGGVRLRLDGTTAAVDSSIAVIPGHWTYVTASYDRATRRLFLSVDYDEVSLTLPADAALGDVAGYQLGPFSSPVSLDDVRVSRGARAAPGVACDECYPCNTP